MNESRQHAGETVVFPLDVMESLIGKIDYLTSNTCLGQYFGSGTLGSREVVNGLFVCAKFVAFRAPFTVRLHLLQL